VLIVEIVNAGDVELVGVEETHADNVKLGDPVTDGEGLLLPESDFLLESLGEAVKLGESVEDELRTEDTVTDVDCVGDCENVERSLGEEVRDVECDDENVGGLRVGVGVKETDSDGDEEVEGDKECLEVVDGERVKQGDEEVECEADWDAVIDED